MARKAHLGTARRSGSLPQNGEVRAAIHVGVCGVLVVALLAPGVLVGPSLDAAVFLVVSDRLTAGWLPYLDTWDHKPPGIYLVQAAALLVLPMVDPWLVSWLLTAVAAIGTAVCARLLLKRAGVGDRLASLLALAVAAGLSTHVVSLGGGLTEHYAALPASAGIAALVGRPTPLRAAGAGIAIGLAVVTSLQFVPAAIAGAWLIATGDRPRGPRLAAYLLGSLAPTLLLVLWLAWSGALPASVEAVLGYSSAYRLVAAPEAATVAGWSAMSVGFLIAPALFGLLAAFRGPRVHDQRIFHMALIWIVGAVLLALLSGRVYAHYAASAVLPLAIVASIGLGRAPSGAHRIARAGTALGIAVALWALAVQGGAEMRSTHAANAQARATAELIRATTDPEDRMFVWGNQPYLYLLADRSAGSRYVYVLPLTTPGYASTARARGLVEELRASAARVIVDAGSPVPGAPGLPPLLEPRPVLGSGRDVDLVEPVRAYVRAEFRTLEPAQGWPVYVRERP